MTDPRRDVAERLERGTVECNFDPPCLDSPLPAQKWCNQCLQRKAAALLREPSVGREPDALERIAAHQRVTNEQHDAANGRLAGHCAICAVPWPCEYIGTSSDSPAEPWPDSDMLEAAWGIIANVGGGDWDGQPADWKEAAERWRDAYHRRASDSPDLRDVEAAEYSRKVQRGDI